MKEKVMFTDNTDAKVFDDVIDILAAMIAKVLEDKEEAEDET